jgi:hypothetical protein
LCGIKNSYIQLILCIEIHWTLAKRWKNKWNNWIGYGKWNWEKGKLALFCKNELNRNIFAVLLIWVFGFSHVVIRYVINHSVTSSSGITQFFFFLCFACHVTYFLLFNSFIKYNDFFIQFHYYIFSRIMEKIIEEALLLAVSTIKTCHYYNYFLQLHSF